MGSTASYDDWEGDTVDSILFESEQLIKQDKIYELDVSTRFNVSFYAFHAVTRYKMINKLVDMGIEESERNPDNPKRNLDLWIYLMIEKRGHSALFQDRVYMDFVSNYLGRYGFLTNKHFLNQPIIVMGKNLFRVNDDPHLVSIDNFTFAEVSLYFEGEAVKDIQFGPDRPMNLIDASPQDRELQRRHIISVAWIKQAIRTTLNGRKLKDCVKEIQFIREGLLRQLEIKSWPQYPDQSRMDRTDFEYCLSLYDAEFSVILKKLDSFKLNPVVLLYVFCSAFDEVSYYIIDDDIVIGRFKVFARGIAELYRNMVHASYNQFIGSRQDNERLGRLTYLLRPHVENWRGQGQFPVRLDLSDPKNKLLKDFFFGENASAANGNTLVIDSRQMLMELYFNAQYDYQTLSQPRLTNHMKLFMHTYGSSCEAMSDGNSLKADPSILKTHKLRDK